MPKFDRNILARFLPNPRAISDFEKLNTSVDKDLPDAIEEADALANQANNAAQQALARIDDVEGRVAAIELAPPLIPQQPNDDLAPPSIAPGLADDLAPAYPNP